MAQKALILLILGTFFNSVLPSVGWTQTCDSPRPDCNVTCPSSNTADSIQMTCNKNSTYYACKGGRPVLSNCICPSNYQLTIENVNEGSPFDQPNHQVPTIKASCNPSSGGEQNILPEVSKKAPSFSISPKQ